MKTIQKPQVRAASKLKFQDNREQVMAILEAFELRQPSYQPVPTGNENSSFAVQDSGKEYILRVYQRNKKTTLDILRELQLMEFLNGRGLPIPKSFPTKTGELVCETVIGQQLWQSILMQFEEGAHPGVYTPALIGNMAGTQARMHMASLEFTNELLGVKRRYNPYQRDGAWDWVLRWTNRSGDNTGLVMSFSHLDFTGDNILVQDDTVTAILDFDDMTYAPLVDCLANSLLFLARVGVDSNALRSYIRAYTQARRLSWTERARLASVLMGRSLRLSFLLV